jgi:hypothetical protein
MGQGSYEPDADTPGTTAIYKDSSVFVAWANNCITDRGPQDIAVSGSPLVSAGDDYMATDKSGVNGVVSLGDGGTATLTFAQPIFDGPGWDFAVFENSFSNDFLELAFVEVSSDGVFYVRFDATSEVQTTSQVGTFDLTDATEINNLAGKYRGQYGTPFDISVLIGIVGLDVTSITHIRVIDVIGSISESYASYDASGNKINDPYPTDFASGGFDLDAIGVINEVPLSVLEKENQINIYPNPASEVIHIIKAGTQRIDVFNLAGQKIISSLFENNLILDISFLPSGIYTVHCGKEIQKLIVN